MLQHETIVTFPKKSTQTNSKIASLNARVLAFADLQYNYRFPVQKLDLMLTTFRNIIQREHIEYIFILGDLIDSLNILNHPRAYARLLDFLRSLAQSTPLILVLGNHDSYFFGTNQSLQITPPELFRKYLHDLEQIPDLHLLVNSIFDDGKIRVLGLELPSECYYFPKGSLHTHLKASQKIFDAHLQKFLPELTDVPNRDYFLLLHSPAFLRYKSPVSIPPDVIVLAGHVHHGLVPPLLDEITKFTNRGLIGPGLTNLSNHRTKYQIFPRNARLRPRPNYPWLSLRPITYLSPQALHFLNTFYPQISYAILKPSANTQKLRLSEHYKNSSTKKSLHLPKI